MSHPVIVSLLLAAAILVVFGCCLGLLLMGSPLARLHYLGPAALLAPVFVAAAIVAEEGLGQAGLKAILIAVLLFVQGPVLAHILGRAISFRQRRELGNEREGQ